MLPGSEIQGFNAASMCFAPVLRWGCSFEPTSLHDLIRMRTVSRENITGKFVNSLLIYDAEIGHRRLEIWETPEGPLTIQAIKTERHIARLLKPIPQPPKYHGHPQPPPRSANPAEISTTYRATAAAIATH